jgi:hypothetical protein
LGCAHHSAAGYSTFTVEQAKHVIGDAGSRVLITEPAFLPHALTWEELLSAAPAGFDVTAAAANVPSRAPRRCRR